MDKPKERQKLVASRAGFQDKSILDDAIMLYI